MASVLRSKKKKNIPKTINEMSPEMLMATLKKKKECNAKALAIVERLCEPCVDEEWLLQNLGSINQSHFEDVTVERSILKLCGYPLCCRQLENVPAKKYHISTRYNKVYDITERKNFCSNMCYKAGMYLKNQLLSSPLWFRDQEVIPMFKLLPRQTSESMGEEVVFMAEKEQLKQDVLMEKRREEIEEVNKRLESVKLDEKCEETLETGSADVEEMVNKKIQFDSVPKVVEYQTIVGGENVVEEKLITGNKETQEIREVREAKIKKEVTLDPVKKVEKCIHEWFTFDTVLYLYGEEKVKEIMKDREDEIKDVIGKKPLMGGPGFNEKVNRMLRFYALLDESAFDSKSVRKDLKPLPDYTAIQEDGRKLEVKVRAFYSGQLEIPHLDDIGETRKESNGNNKEEENEIFLPTIDTHAQNMLRTNILLDRFNKVVPELIRTFTTACCFEIGELRKLVNHFTLSAHNITFKPAEWYLMGFIVIKLLSLRNRQIESLLKSETGRKHVTLFLMNYNLPHDYLDNVVEWLMNVDDLIKKLN